MFPRVRLAPARPLNAGGSHQTQASRLSSGDLTVYGDVFRPGSETIRSVAARHEKKRANAAAGGALPDRQPAQRTDPALNTD